MWIIAVTSVFALTGRPSPPHMPAGPPQVLPQLDGAAFPAFRVAFENGECDADDPGGPGTGTINTAKRLCPDIPDTSLAHKFSTDQGSTWSTLRILDEVIGRCRGQPTPVIDNVTGTIFLAFNDGCNPKSKRVVQGPAMMNSTDDGQHFSAVYKIPCVGSNCGRDGTMPASVVPGDSRGMVTSVSSSEDGVRLWVPTWSGPMYSDNHGASWALARGPNGDAGENSITRFKNGTFDGYVMMMRCENEKNVPGCKDAYAAISFSRDMLSWTDRTPVVGLNPWIEGSADQNSVLGVDGGLVFTHGGCMPGSRAPDCLNGTHTASLLRSIRNRGALSAGDGKNDAGPAAKLPLHRSRRSGGTGMKLLFSRDGFTWKLIKTLWPFDGGYSTTAAINVNPAGFATRFATFFEAGGLFNGRQALIYNNFTVPPGGY